ncbi:hypothetical protein RQM47_16380 [Rubrivirga sp. S365]|uniref:hypothetical protein n=1 Tax=Rubrivirga sp. S365 TaxID=3076080 RepID=UPI0028C8E198|nr:hypothetical protein [Rubrivirga sp. S365]MDT7858227.1 hypothetical protein [Rubrivirga sp. S365]
MPQKTQSVGPTTDPDEPGPAEPGRLPDGAVTLSRAEAARRMGTIGGDRRARGQLLGETGLGVRVTTSTKGAAEYRVVQAELPAIGGFGAERFSRHAGRRGLDEAVAEAARFRHAGMRARLGDEYPVESAEVLARAVLDRVPEPLGERTAPRGSRSAAGS